MNILKVVVDIIFDFGLLINGLLYLPQLIKIYQTKSTQGLSRLTFIGFNFIQIMFILHGLLIRDFQLAIGMGFSEIICGIATIGLFIYRKNDAYN